MNKRIVSLLLAVVMVLSLSLPVMGEDGDDVRQLEEAIRMARKIFEIPEEIKFNDYYAYSMGKEKVWNLYYWNEETDESVNISITQGGVVLNYSLYEPDYSNELKLPEVDEGEALRAVEEFILNVAPDGTLERIRKAEAIPNPLGERRYYFNYYRVENDIPYYDNNIGVSVNATTGKVISYKYNMEEGADFPLPDGIISANVAQGAYIEKLGLKLVYQYYYNYSKKEFKILPVYVPVESSYSYAIDGITGEKTDIGYTQIIYREFAQNAKAEDDMATGGYVLTPEEQIAADLQAKLIPLSEARKIVRSTQGLMLDEGYEMTNWNLGKNWPMENQFVYHLSFRKTVKNEDRDFVYYASASVDANTGEILSFYVPAEHEDKTPIYDFEQSRAIVDQFLMDINPEKYMESEYEEQEQPIYPVEKGQDMPLGYNFSYVRMVNGIEFASNGLSVSFDAVTGKITSYNVNWFDVKFPEIDNVIDEEDAYSVLFDYIGYELLYVNKVKEEPEELEKRLVYNIKSGMPQIIDGFTGRVLNYDLTPHIPAAIPEYTDIGGHFAEEQIKILSKYRVLTFETGEFMPYKELTQKDYFIMLSKLLNRYSIGSYHTLTEGETDDMYKQFTREGILKDGEKDPDGIISREEAIKYLIRLMKYDKIADIPGIFKVGFKDEDEISRGLEGYVAIAAGLKIVSGSNGYFYPGKSLTRGEAAVIIYNYVK